MAAALLIGTSDGLFVLNENGPAADPELSGRDLTAVTSDGGEVWAVADRRSVIRRDRGRWSEVARSEALEITCLLRTPHGVFVGTEEAHLLMVNDDGLVPVEGFDHIEAREKWYTPWGGPPDVRSMAIDLAGRIHVNVHVGGIPRSIDGGRTWEPTIDIDTDIHQVIAHPGKPDVVLAAGAVGLTISEDGGATWRIEEDGLPSTYARAVAVTEDTVLLSASDGPRGGRAAIYRAALGGRIELEKCTDGLPEWFDGNIDSGRLVASGSFAAFATADGRVFSSEDAGERWRQVGAGLPTVRWLSVT